MLPCAMIHKTAVIAAREQHRDFLGRAAPEEPTRPGSNWFAGRGEGSLELGTVVRCHHDEPASPWAGWPQAHPPHSMVAAASLLYACEVHVPYRRIEGLALTTRQADSASTHRHCPRAKQGATESSVWNCGSEQVITSMETRTSPAAGPADPIMSDKDNRANLPSLWHNSGVGKGEACCTQYCAVRNLSRHALPPLSHEDPGRLTSAKSITRFVNLFLCVFSPSRGGVGRPTGAEEGGIRPGRTQLSASPEL